MCIAELESLLQENPKATLVAFSGSMGPCVTLQGPYKGPHFFGEEGLFTESIHKALHTDPSKGFPFSEDMDVWSRGSNSIRIRYVENLGGFEVILTGWHTSLDLPREILQRVGNGETLIYRHRGTVYRIEPHPQGWIAKALTKRTSDSFTKTGVGVRLVDAIRWALDAPEETK
jgi:hypothetical protein